MCQLDQIAYSPAFLYQDEDHTRATSITSSGISGYFTAQENTFDYDDEDEFAGIADDNVTDDVTVRNEVDDSDNETIRHIDDEVQDEDGMVIV